MTLSLFYKQISCVWTCLAAPKNVHARILGKISHGFHDLSSLVHMYMYIIFTSTLKNNADKLNQWMAGGNAGKSSPSPCSTGWICWVKAGQLQVSYHQCGQHTVNQNHKSHPLFLTSMENKYFTGTQRKCWSCWQRTFFNSFQRKFGNKPSSRCLKKVGKKRS